MYFYLLVNQSIDLKAILQDFFEKGFDARKKIAVSCDILALAFRI